MTGWLLRKVKEWLARRMLITEFCHQCGHTVNVVWTADNALWERVCGEAQAPLCVACFDKRAAGLGYFIRWHPVAEDPYRRGGTG